MGTDSPNVLDSLGWAVLHSIWQGGLAFLFVVIWRAALRGKSPAIRHVGQVLALTGCLAAFIGTFAIYLGMPNFVADTGATLSGTNFAGTPRLFSELIAPFDPAATQAGLSLSRITPILACLWAFGFAAMSLRYAFAFGQVQQLRTLGLRNPASIWADRFKRLAQDIGVSSRVQLYISANVSGPMTLGLIKPVVLVPVGFLTGLPADQVEAILRHELAHIRRYDYAVNLVQTGVKTVLFYHPAIHIICRWADQDREQACDDLAVKQGRDPLTLARGLATLRLQSHTSFGVAATGSGKDKPLMVRLARLAGQTPKRGRSEHILMSVMSALLLGSVYLGASSRAEAHPHPVTNPTLPDTIVTARSEPPAPPVPPVLIDLDFAKLTNDGAMQHFIETDKAAHRAFVLEMDSYEAALKAFLESSNLSEDEREGYSEQYKDFDDDVSKIFEDRREAIEEYYEAQTERQMERKEDEMEQRAELIGLDAALKELEFVECEMCSNKETESQKAQLKAIERARKSIETARRDAAMAISKAETAASVAQANTIKTRTKTRAETAINQTHQKRHEDFRDKVMAELLKDGLIKSGRETIFLSHPDGQMSLNGEPMPKYTRGKYCRLWDAYGFTDDNTEITIKPDSLSILTDWKNGDHRTRVTYGTFETETTSH